MVITASGVGGRYPQCNVWSLCVVVFLPLFDDYLRFPMAVGGLPVEQFVSDPAIEAIVVFILPWTTSDAPIPLNVALS